MKFKNIVFALTLALVLTLVASSAMASPLHAQTPDLSPSSLDFGDQLTGSTSTAQTVTLTNNDPADLTIGTLSVSGEFALSNDLCSGQVIASAASCTFDVTFSPLSDGAKTGSVSIPSDSVTSPDSVALSGTGISPALSIDPASLDFDNQAVNSTSATQAVTLSNDGTTDLVLGTLTASGEFALSNDLCSGQTLTPTETCTFDVAFSPLSLGSKDGSISVPSNAASSPDSLPLNGNGWEWTSPTVSSISMLDKTPTSALTVRFKIIFSESVTGVDLSDFALITTGDLRNHSLAAVSGTSKTYTVTVNAGNGNGTIRLKVIDDDSIIDLYNNPLGSVGAGNGDFTGSTTYTISTIPTLQKPTGTTGDPTPEFSWTTIKGATNYKYEIRKGSEVIYSRIISSATCGTQQVCTSTPTASLKNGNYKWRVQALVNGQWRGYSNYKSFTVSTALAGFWKGGPNYSEFYITPDRGYIDNFAIYVTVYACNIYNQKLTYTSLVPLKYKKVDSTHFLEFGHLGSFYFGGQTRGLTNAYGSFGLSGYYWPGCGYLYGGPFKSNPTWMNATKPTASGSEVFEFSVSPLPKDLMIPPTIFDLFNP
jgi:hypothetical protein